MHYETMRYTEAIERIFIERIKLAGRGNGMMKCPVCGAQNSRFIKAKQKKTEDGDIVIHRRRECSHCGQRFSTFECYEIADTEAIFKARRALSFVKSAEQELTSIR